MDVRVAEGLRRRGVEDFSGDDELGSGRAGKTPVLVAFRRDGQWNRVFVNLSGKRGQAGFLESVKSNSQKESKISVGS